MSDNNNNESNEECIEYYLLIDYEHHFFYRVTVYEFENMFEIFRNSKGMKMCKFNEHTKKTNYRLDSFICGCEFMHAKSDWRVKSKEKYKIVGTYYFYCNIYKD